MSIKNILSVIDENYLIALSNKGTLKRALKELDSIDIKLTVNDETVKAEFADGTELTIHEDIKKYQCSCPARDVCKHLVMAILTFQRQYAHEVVNVEITGQIKLGFDKLLAENGTTLEKKAGKQVTKKAFFQTEIDSTVNISENTTLSVTLSSGYKIHFLPDSSIEDAKCTCKASHICGHKIEALLHYIRFKTGSLPEGVVGKIAQPGAEDIDADSLVFMQDFVSNFLQAGLARMPAGIKRQFEHLSVVAHSRRFAYLESIAKRIVAQLELMEIKSARANTYSLLNNLCEFINVCKILRSGKVDKELLGTFKDEYILVPPLNLHGLGAEGWRSDTGYIGITSYFYCDERQEIIQYSSVLPTEYKPDFNAIYQYTEIQGVNACISKMCKSTMKLVNARLSRKKRLSFTKDTNGTVWSNTSHEFIRSISISDFSLIPDLLWESPEKTIITVITPAEYSDYNFDSIEQRITVSVSDKDGRTLQLGLKYKESDKLLVNNIRKFMKEKNNEDLMLVKIFIENGKLQLFPLALYLHGKEIINMSLDVL